MKDNFELAAKLLKVDKHLLKAIMSHVNEIDAQFKMESVSPEDNIYAIKIIVQDDDGNWYCSQDEPHNDSLWADARSDDEDLEDEDEDEDEDDGDGPPLKPKLPVLI